jgi:hypothetical protein
MRLQMKTKMKKADLLEKIRASLIEHQDQYERALKGWTEQMQEAAQTVIERVQDGKLTTFPKKFRTLMMIPELHLDDYEIAIKMLEASVEDEITLEPGDFDQLVLGNWSWKEQWTATNSRYMGE